MKSFVEKFKVEVGEYCERIEAGLLQLEKDRENGQIINDIFRMMHTMKGSGGMFGFDLLSEVTHELESLFEIFRTEGQVIDNETIMFVLKAVDGLKNLMVEEPGESELILADKLKAEAQLQISHFAPTNIENNDTEIRSTTDVIDGSNIIPTTFYISFVPDEDILRNGTNPLYLIDEINALGECNIQISTEMLPALTELNPMKCHVSWYLFVATTESIETLNDVFIFASNNAKIVIEKVADKNVIHQETVLAAFLNAQISGEPWLIEEQNPAGTTDESSPAIPEPTEDEVGAAQKTSSPTTEHPVNEHTTVGSIRVDSNKIDQYMNLVSEFVTAQSRLEQIALGLQNQELSLLSEHLLKLTRQMRDNAFDMSLMPIQGILVRFKRLVYDLSNSLGKEVVLVTEGMETELDKKIIDKLAEPLLHIIRNSLDHGIEDKTTRLSKNKPEVGVISLKAYTFGSYVQIEIEDDGAGMNINKIREKAISKGLINSQEDLSDEEILQFVFEAGFSTSEQVTDVSGRGVGMDVVKRSVQSMRGLIELDSEPDKFTRFTIKLPLSLSIIDGVLVKVGSDYFVIPSTDVVKLYMIKSKKLKINLGKELVFDDVQFPYLILREKFDCQGTLPNEQYVVVVSYGTHLYGLVVDEVVREYQAVIKPLGRIMSRCNVFLGASILGTGQLSLLIDTNKLIQKYA